jgi:hypothetical protein
VISDAQPTGIARFGSEACAARRWHPTPASKAPNIKMFKRIFIIDPCRISTISPKQH